MAKEAASSSSSSSKCFFLLLFALAVCSSSNCQVLMPFARISAEEEFEQSEHQIEKRQLYPSFHRELQSYGEMIDPPAVITVPATNPVTYPPTNPVTTPATANPIIPTVPPNPPVPFPGSQQPITTNPVTTYPAPPGNVPSGTPITNPPAVSNSPTTPGQTWCVAKGGVPEISLQKALDYACGIGGADCSLIQQGGSCYNPNTLEKHASYAFNSYYQKKPTADSCVFGGSAVLTNVNPSAGSCVYPSSSSSSSSTSSSTPPSIPSTTTTVPQPSSEPGAAGYGSPASVFGSEIPPALNTSTSQSTSVQLFPGRLFLFAFLIAGIFEIYM